LAITRQSYCFVLLFAFAADFGWGGLAESGTVISRYAMRFGAASNASSSVNERLDLRSVICNWKITGALAAVGGGVSADRCV
jgi:hypothetical protein